MMGAIDERRRMAAVRDPELRPEEVRRRIAWARRQGRPAWLWPETPVEAWRTAMDRIGTVTAAMLAGDARVRLEGEAEAIGLAGYTSGMGPLLGYWLEQGGLETSRAVAEVLDRHLAHNRRRAATMAEAAVMVAGRLTERGIGTVVLKGMHTGAVYFPEPGVRPASDIDLLVEGADEAMAEAVMRSCGLAFKGRNPWESNWAPPTVRPEPRSLTYVHAEDLWSIDLHTALKISTGEGAPLADLDLARPMASGGRWPVDGRARVLDQPLLLIHLAAHAGAGWQSLTLVRLVELVLTIRQDLEAGRLEWGAFVEVGDLTGALGYAYPALRLVEKLAPGTVPGPVIDHCAAKVPAPVREALEKLTPATAQRIDRNSVGEHFMWSEGWQGRLRQLASDIQLRGRSWPEFRRIYEERAWRLIRGRVSQ
jgi:hypothetical protein